MSLSRFWNVCPRLTSCRWAACICCGAATGTFRIATDSCRVHWRPKDWRYSARPGNSSVWAFAATQPQPPDAQREVRADVLLQNNTTGNLDCISRTAHNRAQWTLLKMNVPKGEMKNILVPKITFKWRVLKEPLFSKCEEHFNYPTSHFKL